MATDESFLGPARMPFFDNAESVYINGQEVQSIVITESGAILFEKGEAPTEINPILWMGYTKINQRILLEVVDSTNGDIVEDANYMLRGEIIPTQGLPSPIGAKITNGVAYLSAPDGDCFIKLGNEEQGISKEVFFLYQNPNEGGLSRVIDITKTIEITINGAELERPTYAYSPQFKGEDIIIMCDGKFVTHSDLNADFTYTFDTFDNHNIVMYNVTELNQVALYNLSQITQINLYEGLENLKMGCFYQTKITEINIPNSVTSMGANIFQMCNQLTSIILNWTTQNDIIPYDSTWIQGISTPPIFTVPTGTKQLYIDKGYPSAQVYEEPLKFTFSGTTLTQHSGSHFSGTDMMIDYGDGTIKSTTGNFRHTYSENGTYQVKIYGVTSLGLGCFYNCAGLISIIIPDSITNIGDGCFSKCADLTSVTIPPNITSLGNSCFYNCTGLTSINLPNNVTSLGSSCFKDCTHLTSIDIPNNVISLGAQCFYGCAGLTSIEIPSSVTSLGNSCFNNCTGLTSIEIPLSVTNLGDSCFNNCTGLTSINIPSSVTSLGVACFLNCSSLNNYLLNWTSSSTIIAYDSDKMPSRELDTVFTIPKGTTQLYIDKGYPSNNLDEPTK